MPNETKDETKNETKDENAADSVIQEGTKQAGTAKKPKEPMSETSQELVDIDMLAEENGLSDWEKAGLFHAAGWAAGRLVSSDDFAAALERFRNRRMGGGMI